MHVDLERRKTYQQNYYQQHKERLKKNASQYYSNNRDREMALRRERYHANPEAHKSTMLMRAYGITIEEYKAMESQQEDCCYLCGTHKNQLTKSLAVDHCHKTGTVRKLLCTNCNTVLGKVNEDPELLRKMIHYLDMFSD